jgi:hypothetical protein
MTLDDRAGFTQEFLRMVAANGRAFDPAQCDAYFDYLKPYDLAAVRQALPEAVRRAGRFMPTVGAVAEVLLEQRGAGRGQQQGPARPTCPRCEGRGFLARLTGTGQVLDHEELRVWERTAKPTGPREDGQPHYWMTRCVCKTGREVAA